MKILKCLLMIVTAPVILVLTLFVWLCTGLIYISGLVLGLLSTVIALLGVAVLITYSPQNGAILLVSIAQRNIEKIRADHHYDYPQPQYCANGRPGITGIGWYFD